MSCYGEVVVEYISDLFFDRVWYGIVEFNVPLDTV